MQDLSALEELRKFLVQFSEDIAEKSAEYHRRVLQMCETGIPVQVAEHYEANYGVQNLRHLQDLVVRIRDIDLPYISTEIAKFDETLVFRDTKGNRIVKKIGNRIWDFSGNWLYEIRGNRVWDTSGNWIYELRGNRVWDTSGNWLYEIRDNRIWDTKGNWLAFIALA